MNGLDDLLNQFGPTPEEKRQALKQALIVSGLGLLGTPKGQEWRGIGRAGLLGVGDYNEQLQQGALQKGRNMLLAEKAMEMRDKQAEREARAAQAKQQQEAFNALMSMPGAIEGAAPAAGQANGIPAPFQQPGGAAALVNKELGIQVPEQTQLPTAPAIAAQQTAIGGGQSDKLMAQANYLEEVARATRNPTALVMAQKMRDDAMKLRLDELKTREEFTAPMVGIGPDGKPTYFRPGKWGSNRPVSEVRPPPDIKIEDFGGSKRAVDLLTTAPGTTFEKTPTKDALLADARAREFNAIRRAEAAAAGGTASVAKSSELRKEFNGLPQVKAYNEVMPVLQSAREAVNEDTAAADLNLIYAAAKIFDPTSVVRESETSMVMSSGSPAQRFMGQWNYVASGGRLTKETRQQLMAQVESRGRGYESGYKAARSTYEPLAKKLGIDPTDVFIEPYVKSKSATSLAPSDSGRITTKEQYDALPSGAVFVDDKGITRRKR